MTFRILGTRYRFTLPGDPCGDPITVSASGPSAQHKRVARLDTATVFLTKPYHVSGREESIGMTPDQARAIAALLVEAASWCDAVSENSRGA